MHLSLCIQLSRRHGKVRRFHPTVAVPADRGPREQMLLGFSISPEVPCRATQTAEMMIPQNVAPMRFWAFPPQPEPEPFADIPIEIGKDARGSGTVAVVIRPSAQDGIDFLERFAKTARCSSCGAQFDFLT